jgi:hypothetical protein
VCSLSISITRPLGEQFIAIRIPGFDIRHPGLLGGLVEGGQAVGCSWIFYLFFFLLDGIFPRDNFWYSLLIYG